MTRWTARLSRRRTLWALTTVLLLVTSCGSGGSTADLATSTVGSAPTSGPDRTVETSTAPADPSVSAPGPVLTSAATTVTTAATTSLSESRTVTDLEQALAAEIGRSSSVGPGQARCEASGTLTDWEPILCFFSPDEPAEYGGSHVSILTGGRYIWELAGCCGAGPWPDDYPDGLLCRDLIKPPSTVAPDFYRVRESDHLSYGLAVYYWLTEGRPARMDADGNGRPCETVYPAEDAEAFWASVRTL